MRGVVVLTALCLVIGGTLIYLGVSSLLGNSLPMWLSILAVTAAIVLTLVGHRMTRLKKPK